MPAQSYTYEYPRPILAADSAVFTVIDGAIHVLLVRRGHEPYEGCWAFPGGFVNENEPVDEAGARELREETGLTDVPLRQMQVFGDPGRDPRGWTVSVVYLAVIDHRAHTVTAGDDAREAQWFPLAKPPRLAFDHDRILEYAVKRLVQLVGRGDRECALLPSTIGETERKAFEAEILARATA